MLEWHRLRTHILMDAGELGSRNMTVVWIEVPPGTSQDLRSHEDSEQVYVVVQGEGTMSAAGDTQRLTVGDLALIPPATDHAIANGGDGGFACISVVSPAVSVDELFDVEMAAEVAGFEEDEY